MDADFNAETKYLVIRPEYSQSPTEITVRQSAYGGTKIDETRIFDPVVVIPEEYESYYYRGFSFVFDVIDK